MRLFFSHTIMPLCQTGFDSSLSIVADIRTKERTAIFPDL